MLSSNSSSCNHNPNYRPFSENDITSFTSKLEDPNNFFFGFPNSPHMQLEYEDVYLHFFDHHHHQHVTPAESDLDLITNMAADSNANAITNAAGNPNSAAAAVRSRSLKKDRHSKINTARGPRDRRMRLSLDIARKFFDLQDLLGYDKASRTVDWLLRNSSSAIRNLARGRDNSSLVNSESCTSEDYGEAVSSSAAAAAAAAAGSKNRSGKKVKRGGGGGVLQKRATVARESRRKARERARERTSQKRRLMRESSGVTHNFPIYDAAAMQVEDLSSDETRLSEGALCPWNSFHFNNTNTAFLHQDEQIAEFQFNGKPWNAYSSFNMSV